MSTLQIWILIGFLAICLVVGMVGAARVTFHQNEQKRKEQEEKIKRVLGSLTFAVRVRTLQGKKCDMETSLIDRMVARVFKVLKTETFENLHSDTILILAVYESAGGLGPGEVHYLDMRAIIGDRIVAARHFREYSMSAIGERVVMYLADVLE